MRYEDVILNPTTQGLKILDTLHTQDIVPTQIKMVYNQKISLFQDETTADIFDNNYLNITIADSIPRMNYVIGDADGEHHFYCGDVATADDGDLVMKISDTRIDMFKPLYFNNAPF